MPVPRGSDGSDAANDDRRLGVLLISGGRTHQESYARDFAADPRCRLVGLVDEAGVSRGRAAWNAQLAAELGIPHFSDLDAALARDDVQLVSVCSEPERRPPLAAKAARAGKHIYSDKPLGTNLEQIDQLVASVAAAKVHSQMFSLVRTPWAERSRAVVQSGALGPLRAVHIDLLFAKGHPGSVPSPGLRRRESLTGNFEFVDAKREVFTTAIYAFVHLLWLTGSKVARVRAVTANYFFAEHLAHDIEDFGLLLVDLDDGASATISAGRIGWNSHAAGGPMQLLLVGTQGQRKIDAYRPRLSFSTFEPAWKTPPAIPEDPMGFWNSTQALAGVTPKTEWQSYGAGAARSDASHFVDCILAGQESDVSLALAAHATEAIVAAYESVTQGRAIELPLSRK